MEFTWLNGTEECPKHKDVFEQNCTCDAHIKLLQPRFIECNKFVSNRTVKGIVRTSQEMIEDLANQMAATWKLTKGIVRKIHGDNKIQRALLNILGDVGVNQIPIPPPFPNYTLPRETHWQPKVTIFNFYRMIDRWYFDKYHMIKQPKSWWQQHIWKEIYGEKGQILQPGTSWEYRGEGIIPFVRAASFYNMSFAGVVIDGERYNYSEYSQSDLYPSKVVKLIAKYDKPTHIPPKMLQDNMHILPLAIKAMASFCGWDAKYGTLHWSLLRSLSKIKPPFFTASGLRPGDDRVELSEDGSRIRIFRSVNGKKVENFEWALNTIDSMLQEFIQTGNLNIPEPYYTIVVKSEVHLANGVSTEFVESLKKIRTKAREYFIPDLVTLCLAMMVHSDRQNIERGVHRGIKIGHTWWHGGMEFFANAHKYTSIKRFFLMFDITGFDTSVIELFLNLYAMYTLVYYQFASDQERSIMIMLLKLVTERLSCKVTKMLGSIWRIILGVMPSGAFETSHGDSWIVLLMFFCYCIYMCLTNAEFRRMYQDMMVKALYCLMVYGDDNVSSFPEGIHVYFSPDRIKCFFKDFGGFELRDVQMLDYFLSECTPYGTLSKKGVVFLQKYAVKTPKHMQAPGMPLVVHYRSIETNVRKFSKGSGDMRRPIDYLLSAITGPYDNPCNIVWYEFCEMAYHYFLKEVPDWENSIDEILRDRQGSINKAMKKAMLDKNTLLRGFPSHSDLQELLMVNRDKYEKSKYYDIWSDSFKSAMENPMVYNPENK